MMRRVLGAYVAGLLVLVGLVAAPAAAEDEPPPQVQIVDAPTQIPIDAQPRLIGAVLVPTPSDASTVSYAWDVDGDGFDDGTNNAIIWNPAEHDIGTFTVQVRATVDGVLLAPATAIIEVINQFEVSFGLPVTVTTGEKAFIGATVRNFPWDSVRSYRWDLDGDNDFDDVANTTTEYVEPSWSTPGEYTIQVKVTHDQLADGAAPAMASTTVIVIPRVSLTPPALPTRAKAGQVLNPTEGIATPADAARTWTWQREGGTSTTTTVPSYTLTTADSGRWVRVRVDATRANYGDAYGVTSNYVRVNAACTVRPTFTGTARVGRRLTGTKGTWRQVSHTFSYRWLRDSRPIIGATRSTYVTTRADRGHLISLRVTATRSGFTSVSATSAARRIY